MRNPFFLLTTPVFCCIYCILKTLKAMNQEIQQYQSDDARITLDVRVENDTVWLTQAQMAQLFSRDISVVSRHIRNIFQVGELEQKRNLPTPMREWSNARTGMNQREYYDSFIQVVAYLSTVQIENLHRYALSLKIVLLLQIFLHKILFRSSGCENTTEGLMTMWLALFHSRHRRGNQLLCVCREPFL